MLHLKVLNGTKSDKRLCDSCRSSTIMTDSHGRERIYCAALTLNADYVEIKQKIVDCSDYRDKTAMTRHEAFEIGWILQVKGRTIIGFKPPEKKDE